MSQKAESDVQRQCRKARIGYWAVWHRLRRVQWGTKRQLRRAATRRHRVRTKKDEENVEMD